MYPAKRTGPESVLLNMLGWPGTPGAERLQQAWRLLESGPGDSPVATDAKRDRDVLADLPVTLEYRARSRDAFLRQEAGREPDQPGRTTPSGPGSGDSGSTSSRGMGPPGKSTSCRRCPPGSSPSVSPRPGCPRASRPCWRRSGSGMAPRVATGAKRGSGSGRQNRDDFKIKSRSPSGPGWSTGPPGRAAPPWRSPLLTQSLTRGNRDRLDRKTFRCIAYGHTADTEVNAAENIRRQGIADPLGVPPEGSRLRG